MKPTLSPLDPPARLRALAPVGGLTAWTLLVAYVILMLPTQWVKAVLPYYGDVVFGTLMMVVALPYLFLRSFWRGSTKWAIILLLYGLVVTGLTRNGEAAWQMGPRELILDIILFIALGFGLKLGEASFVSLQSLVSRISWCCVCMGAANILLLRFNYVQIDADATNRIVSISLFYVISPLLFLVPLQVVFRLGIVLPTLSVAMVGLVAYFTLTRSIAIAFFLLFGQLLLLWLRRLMGGFATAFTVWLFLILPLMGLGTYFMLDSITGARGMDNIADTTGRNIEFEEFTDQMSNRGWVLGNGLGTGFMMNGYDPDTGAPMKVIATGLHFTTLTPVLKLGVVITLLLWITLLYGVMRVCFMTADIDLKAVILVPFNYAVVYSISGGWLASVYLILGLALYVIFNFRSFVVTASLPHTPLSDGRPVLQRRHR